MEKKTSLPSSFISSEEFYQQLFRNNGHMLEGRNLIGKPEPEQLPDHLPGYCSECGDSLIYPHGIAVCPSCSIEYPDVIPLDSDLRDCIKDNTRMEKEETEIY